MDHERAPDAGEPDLDVILRRIVDGHHRRIREESPVIAECLGVLVGRHGERHPELAYVREAFLALTDVLLSHLVKEENLLFPFINDLAAASRSGTRPPRGPFVTLMHPIRVMESGHQTVTASLDRLKTLTRDYAVPPEAAEAYRSCYQRLAAFDDDVRQHMRLENDTVFPRALALESHLG